MVEKNLQEVQQRRLMIENEVATDGAVILSQRALDKEGREESVQMETEHNALT